MQTEAVRAFVTICDRGSFQAAARTLHLSQPAISKRLANLEERLGHALFDRLGHGVELTEAGRVYLPYARTLLAALQDGARALDTLGGRVAGPLRLTLSHHVGLHRMPDILRRYVARYPAVAPEIAFADSEVACLSVTHGERELAVITLPTPSHPVLIEQVIWDDPMGVFVGRDHVLAAATNARISDLNDHAAVLPPIESYTYAIIQAAFREHGVAIAPRMTSHYLETLRMLADIGIGWTVLPIAMQPPELVRLALPELQMHRRLGVIRHPRRSLSNAARALIEMLERTRNAEAG